MQSESQGLTPEKNTQGITPYHGNQTDKRLTAYFTHAKPQKLS
ncbi:MAG: hypothetical protein U9R29_00340 [Thermodesulfobacteriota bacterium]|nr:hypothetical protein [Thermodesulfobacteriota bacterium]